MNFADLGLSEDILQALEKKGFQTPSAVQAGVIPLFLQTDKDIIAQAQTGTGKTASFGLPLLEKIDPNKTVTQAIILAPTRELAIQVATELESFQVSSPVSIGLLYGGNDMEKERRLLRKNPQIVVGTPGRVNHHIRKKTLRFDQLKYFILDEADEMLNFGFREEIEETLETTPQDKRVLLFSATMPKSIMSIVHNYMGEYEMVKVEAKTLTNENITQKYYCVAPRDKFEALCRIMEMEDNFYAIVFCRTKADTDLVASQLAAKHYHAEAIHGDIDQNQREKILARFKEGRTNILVATDVAARGIDVAQLNFVVNYSLPENHEIYTHRIGRTGRAGNKGTAVTLIPRRDVGRFEFFQKKLGIKVEKGVFPEGFEIVQKKQKHLLERTENILENDETRYLEKLSKKLLKLGDPEKVLAALIKESYGDDFDQLSYRVIKDDAPKGGFKKSGFKGRKPNPYGKRNSSGYQHRKKSGKKKTW